MRQLTIYIFLILLISACGGRSGNSEQDGTANLEKSSELQEDAIREKYLALGKQIATETQKELLSVVQGAMASGGPVYAVDYCNIEALDLKDSLSRLNDCTIQRLSTKYRNPADKPESLLEIAQLDAYALMHAAGDTLTPEIHVVEDHLEYYQPIMIGSGACLVCHGDPDTQIARKTMSIINELYPKDKAVGYAMNDFRGVWKITFLHGEDTAP